MLTTYKHFFRLVEHNEKRLLAAGFFTRRPACYNLLGVCYKHHLKILLTIARLVSWFALVIEHGYIAEKITQKGPKKYKNHITVRAITLYNTTLPGQLI